MIDQNTTTELIMGMDSNNDRPGHNYGTYHVYGLEYEVFKPEDIMGNKRY